MLGIVIALVILALIFDFINGFHDAANSIATVVSTRVLSPGIAVLWAAFFNFIAAFGGGVKVANTMGKGIIHFDQLKSYGTHTVLAVIFAALIGAIAWNLITWWFGLPSSSSHALIGGLVGAALVQSGEKGVLWPGVAHKVVIPALVAPVVAGAAAFAVLILLLWTFARVHQ